MRIYPKDVTPKYFNRGSSSVSPRFPIRNSTSPSVDREKLADACKIIRQMNFDNRFTLDIPNGGRTSLAKKRQRAKIDEHTYELRARIFDSFGEDAFRVELRRL